MHAKEKPERSLSRISRLNACNTLTPKNSYIPTCKPYTSLQTNYNKLLCGAVAFCQ